jgi:hypothetical protein
MRDAREDAASGQYASAVAEVQIVHKNTELMIAIYCHLGITQSYLSQSSSKPFNWHLLLAFPSQETLSFFRIAWIRVT